MIRERQAEAEPAQGSASGGDLRPDFREAEGESRPCYFPKASSLVHGISTHLFEKTCVTAGRNSQKDRAILKEMGVTLRELVFHCRYGLPSNIIQNRYYVCQRGVLSCP